MTQNPKDVRPEPLEPFERADTHNPDDGDNVNVLLSIAVMVLTTLLVLILAAAALWLPPFNLMDRVFGAQYVMLDAQGNAARSPDGRLTFILDGADTGDEFGVALETQPAETFLEAEDADAAQIAARESIPTRLTLQSPVYSLRTTGTAPTRSTVSVDIPASVEDTTRLDLYGYDAAAGAWSFVPSQPIDGDTQVAELRTIPDQLALFSAASPSAPTVLVPVDVTTVLTEAVGNVATIVSPAGMQPSANGQLVGSLAAGVDPTASYRVMPVIRNFGDARALDVDTVTQILSDEALRAAHVQGVVNFAGAYRGVFIDYRNLPDDQRENFSRFVEALAAELQPRGLKLGVVVPAAENASGSWQTGAYDWRALGQAADFVQVNVNRVNPAMFADGEDRLVQAMLRWGVGEISRYKLIVGLSALSQRQASGGFEPIGYSEALEPLGELSVGGDLAADGSIIPGETFELALTGNRAVSGLDEPTQTLYIDYLDANDTPITRVWLTTDEALSFRLGQVNEFAVGGAAFTDLARGDLADNVLSAIANYKLAMPFQPTRTGLSLRWRLMQGDTVIVESESGLDESVVATVNAPEGDYNLSVAVVGDETEQERSGRSVALAAPTATPTPLPSPTPTPLPTATPTPDPAAIAAAQAQATQAAQAAAAPSGGGFSAAPPAAGSMNLSGFEYGGHVTGAGSERAAQAMRSAGMTWMKTQIRWSPGGGTGDAANAINSARAKGFKVLIGAMGYPQDLAAGGDAYIQEYAAWLGAVAALGPDAIEVWNEPNIDREWPRGQISGGAYTNMLRASYNAIKSTNSSVIVISGAPAPTGAENAFPGQVVNDDNFLRQMADAGGMQYMDCLGMHYNEGIVPPTARSGDPRGDYHTRYLGTMLDVYWNATGGQRPICITELGYLTSAGYPPLDPYFSWASNTTLQQHANWLAQAAVVASQSGRVRLMIVWNVDFTVYGADPQGGFAMIRPDGSCPACNAMAAAR